MDSPRLAEPLLKALEARGGVRFLVLSHIDDVAEHEALRRRFGCERVMHRADGLAGLERYLDGEEPEPLAEDLLLIPTPGHTAGSTCLLYRETFLFTGDHLWWNPERRRLSASRSLNWHSWKRQLALPREAPVLRLPVGAAGPRRQLSGRVADGDAARARAGAGRAAAPLTARVAAPLPAVAASPERLGRTLAEQAFSRAAGAPLVGGNRVRLLQDARENYPAWLDAIERARRFVHFETYIVHEDATGRRFAEALGAKARAGRAVRLIHDWFGGLGKASRRFWRGLREAGVEVRVYNPPQLDSPFGWVSRDHRKMIGVDGDVAFVSGLCVGDMWAGQTERGISPWRDTGVEVRGRRWPTSSSRSPTSGRAWASRCPRTRCRAATPSPPRARSRCASSLPPPTPRGSTAWTS